MNLTSSNIIIHTSLHADAASSLAKFNDSRCTGSGVCLNDPLLFTCELNKTFLLRVVLPNGVQEVTAIGDNAEDIALDNVPGVIVKSFNVTAINGDMRNFSLTLSIINASLLDGGEIMCDDTTNKVAKASCKLQLQGM